MKIIVTSLYLDEFKIGNRCFLAKNSYLCTLETLNLLSPQKQIQKKTPKTLGKHIQFLQFIWIPYNCLCWILSPTKSRLVHLLRNHVIMATFIVFFFFPFHFSHKSWNHSLTLFYFIFSFWIKSLLVSSSCW